MRPRSEEPRREGPSSSRWSTVVVAVIALAAGAGGVHLLRGTPEAQQPVASAERLDSAAPVVSTATVLLPPIAPLSAPVSAAPPPPSGTSAPTANATASTTAKAMKPAPPPPKPFDHAGAQQQLDKYARNAQMTCRYRDGPRGFAVSVRFSPKSGAAVQVSTQYRSHELGSSGRCVWSTFMRAKVAPFDGAPVTLSAGVALKSR